MNSTEARSPATRSLRVFPSTVIAMLFRSAGVVAVLAIPVVSGLGAMDASAPGERPGRQQVTAWKAAYSEQYPGCVPRALWPADESPVALITQRPDGRVDKVALDAKRRPLRSVPNDARTIGACR